MEDPKPRGHNVVLPVATPIVVIPCAPAPINKTVRIDSVAQALAQTCTRD